MFSKSTMPLRNDPITRRDGKSGINAGIATTNEAVPTLPAVAADAVEKSEALADKPQGARLIVGPEVKLKGAEILDCDTLVVEGRVEATMDSRVIRIADHGAFSGKVSIDVAEIFGRFDGELTARSQLIIHATGRVSGKIRYGKLVIDEGGELCGDVHAIGAEQRLQADRAIEKLPMLNAVSNG